MLERPGTAPHDERRAARGGRRRTRRDVVGTLPVAAVTAAVWAAALGLVVVGVLVTVAWAVSARGDGALTAPLGASGVVWLAAHHAPVDAPSGSVTFLPMLLLALPLLLLHRAGRWAARVSATTEPSDAALLVVAAAAAYTTVAFLVGQGASLGGAGVSAASSVLWPGLVAVLGLGAGVAEGAGLLPGLVAGLPPVARRAGLVAAVAGCALVAVAGLAVAASVALHWSVVAGMSRQAAPAPGDAAGLLLVSLAYLPNLVVWALAYVAGPGFGVGGGAAVTPYASGGALLPVLPALGAVPSPAPVAAPLLLLLPVAAGVLASLALRRRGGLELREEVVALLGGAGLLGLVTAVLCLLAGGSLGSGRLVGLGPSALVVAVAVTGLVAAGAVLWSLVVRIAPTVWVSAEH